jgi:phospholipid transport system substrate-binding protein
MFRLERMIPIVLTFLALVTAAPSAAAESAKDFIKARQDEVITLLQKQKSAGTGRDKKVADVLAKMLDYDHLARQSLASHWNDLSDPQRNEFTDVLRQLVQRSYERNIKEILDFNVDYLGEEARDAGRTVVVRTRASPKTNKGDEPVTIDYWMDQPDGKWRVVDIVTEDSSLVSNYKSQFHRTIQKEGYAALIRKMNDRLAKGEKF